MYNFASLIQMAQSFAQNLMWLIVVIRGNVAKLIQSAFVRNNPVRVQSLQDLRTLCHQSTLREDGSTEFLCSTFTFVDHENKVYYGQSDQRLTLDVLNKSLQRVPDDDVYPAAPSHITSVVERDSSTFFKGPMLTFFADFGGSRKIARALLQEAETLEFLQRNPHPNIVRYRGCQLDRGRIIGVLLERHPWTLEEYSRKQPLADCGSGFDGIESGVQHLWDLGLAHNDIKPSNIMIAEDNTWVLIDMGSCRPIGEELIVAGRSEWDRSQKEHDVAALGELWTWLEQHAIQTK